MVKMRKNGKKEEKRGRKKDPYLLEAIQPVGGVTFRHESYILTGSGYQTCLHVFEYPQKLSNHWLTTVFNISNTIAVIDYDTVETQEVKRNLNKSMEEQDLRYQSTENYSEKFEAKLRFQEMQRLFTELSTMAEIVKLVHVRIFVAARTLAELEKNAEKIADSLGADGYKAGIMLNEMENEWDALYLPYDEQQKVNCAMEGQPIASKVLSAGNPFYFSDLEDENGSYFGFTACGGNFLFDMFHADEKRKNYNAVVAGLMGSGKSTLLKKLFKDRAIRGDFIRTFDATGEFTDLTYELGGRVIALDGSHGMVNPLEIFKADENEKNNYPIHITKLLTFYRLLKPDAGTEELNAYQQALDGLYEKFDIRSDRDGREERTAGLPVERYPVFQDFIVYLEERIQELTLGSYNDLEKEVALHKILLLNRVKETIYTAVSTFGSVFNAHTSIKITDEQIVTFNIKSLREMAPNISQAIICNMLTLCWNDSVINGAIMKKAYEKGEIAFEDIVRFLVIIDEAPKIISTRYMQTFDIITQFLREGRKYFIGIILAAQSIKHFFPSLDAGRVEAMSEIFELSQYKFVFQQDQSVEEIIEYVFKGSLTEMQIGRIPKLERGECFAAISGVRTYQLKVDVSEEELQIFSGGV